MVVMLIMPAWAMLWKMFNPETGWLATQNYKLLTFGIIIEGLQLWLMIEGLLTLKTARGNYPDLEPLPAMAGAEGAAE